MTIKLLAAGAALLALLPFHPQSVLAGAPPAPKAAAFCKKIQTALQPYSKIPLVLFTAEDSTNDDFHTGEAQYRHCQFRQADGSMIDIGMHEDSDGMFDDATKNGYGVLSGYGDKGRYTVRGSAGQKWLDLVRAKTACEARFALDDDGSPLNRDWKEVGGKTCTLAFTWE
jgi:hypothetical protein